MSDTETTRIEEEYKAALLEFEMRQMLNQPADPIERAKRSLEYERTAARLHAAWDALIAMLTKASSTPPPLP